MTKDWKRLADAVVRRRAKLGRLTQAQIAHRSGISLDRIQAIEGAKSDRYRRVTLMALEQALEWEPGSIDEILAGGDPTPAGQQRTADEMLTEMEKALTRIEKGIEARADDRDRPMGEAAISVLRAILEKSTTSRSDT